MAVTRTIGKNTLGDNEKMKVHMHDYEMSSHNLSYVFRSTIGVGMLVPFMKIVAQKGDIFDIQLINKTMTHPTRGPLFGAFKLQHFVFTAGFRLYNSWLHNNRTGIGMKMSDIKLPAMGIEVQPGTTRTNISPSALYSYLGWKGSRRSNAATASTKVTKQAVPLLIYIDIFKNYFANTQEENFYTIGIGSQSETVTINAQLSGDMINHQLLLNQEGLSNVGTIGDQTLYLTAPNEVTNYKAFWESIQLIFVQVTGSNNVKTTKKVSEIITSTYNLKEISTELPAHLQSASMIQGFTIITGKEATFDSAFGMGIIPHKLEVLDKTRDEILKKNGNSMLLMDATQDADVNNLFKNIYSSQSTKLGGMFLKTYDSDIFNNWVQTEWIDGDNGINKITALKPDADGNITMDALNLQQKVYNMLNRIAVSGGTYRDWLETVYTAGRYLDRPETPVFQGGMSQIIEFDEVIATSSNATDSQVLGDLAGRGYARKPNGSGHLHFQVEEPGYVFGVLAITPICDYSQGNDFDLNLRTMDDLHKPALDGIGYQDSMNEQRAWWTADNQGGSVSSDTTVGKTVAWIDYMTNFNKTFGNFAAGENEDFMVLNRNYEEGNNNSIANISSYINPQEHIDIFADTALDSQNFWVQTACQITKRGNYSAKQIPNL